MGLLDGALGAIAGGTIGAVGSFLGQESANKANSAQAARSMAFSEAEAARSRAFSAHQSNVNRTFQERHIRNRYEYTMNSMRHAGLNPILAYQQGGGSAPSGSSMSAGQGSGAQATMQNSVAGAADAFGKTVNSAIAAKKLKSELEILDEERRLINMKVAEASSNIGKNSSQEDVNHALKIKLTHEGDTAKYVSEANKFLKNQLARDSKYELDNPELMKIRKWMGAFGSILGSGNSAKKLAK